MLLRHAVLWRAVRMIALGLAINALAAWWLPDRQMRWPGVLQRIGVCFWVVAMLAIYAPWRAWWGTLLVLLLSYTAILVVGGPLVKWDNVVDQVDHVIFGRYVWEYNQITGKGHDPEGLLSTLSALSSGLTGLIVGVWLRARQLRQVFLLGISMLILGGLWSCTLPLNKNLWTPSFVLWTSGWAIMSLLVLHFLIDQRGLPAWGRRLGVNAIAAYVGSELMQIILPASGWQTPIYRHLFLNTLDGLASERFASLSYAIVFVALWWCIAWVMDRRRIYLKI